MKKLTMYVEVKINNMWEFEQKIYIEGNNTLFALLADVENENGDVIPIKFPKGFPADCSDYLKQKYSPKNNNHSFLSIDEVMNYNVPMHKDFDMFMCTVHDYNLERLSDYIEDVRFVFWFDE